MAETLILKPADVDTLASMVAVLVAKQLEPLISQRNSPNLVDRPTMAELANIGTATLDCLVSAKLVPSVLVGRRRLFEPQKVIDAIGRQSPDAIKQALRDRRGGNDGEV